MDEKEKRADIVLSDGTELDIDLYKVSIKEWRSMFDPEQSDEEGDKLLAKIVGTDVEYLQSLSQPDFRLVLQSVILKAREPLLDPNSQSGSTED